MLFNSWTFIGLMLLTATVYYLPLFRRVQVWLLLLSGFAFYAYDSAGMLLLLIASALLNAVTGYGARYLRHARLYATLGVVLNLLLLAMFKYGGLISSSFFDTSDGVGHLLCMLPLPLGISFYTFSGISLVVDAYRGKAQEQGARPPFMHYVRETLLYITFFPKLLAGPIAKSKEFVAQIGQKSLSDVDWTKVFKALVTGYFLKMVIADNMKDFTFWMAYPYFEYRGTGSLLLMVFGYSIQIFADFAGYSLIAIGVAAIFGYKLPTNFYFPYIASSFRDFWKRWHITLSQFLMEYLYISLGGNRKGKSRTYLNLLLTMMLGGLWHGAAWSYLVWGTWHGLWLAAERALCGRRENVISLGAHFQTLSHWLSMMLVFIMVSMGWLLFMLPDFGEAAHYVQCIFTNYGKTVFIDPKLLPIMIYAMPVVVYHAMYYFRERGWMQRYVLRYDYLLYGLMLFLTATNSGSAGSFVYFQF